MSNGPTKMIDDVQKVHEKMLTHKAFISALVEEAQRRKWYGKLTIIFEKGEICRIVKEESILPPSIGGK